MQALKGFIKTHILCTFILFFLSVATHLFWYIPTGDLWYGDWLYWTDIAVENMPSSFSAWSPVFGLGNPNPQLSFWLFKSVWYVLSLFGMNYTNVVRLTFLVPISLFGMLFPYFYIYKLVRDRLIAFVSALFYGSFTYFLVLQTNHLPIAFVYSVTPLILLLMQTGIEKNTVANWITLSLVLTVITGYEIRITVLIFTILFFQFLFLANPPLKAYSKNLFILLFIYILLNLYWLLPTLKGIDKEVVKIASRGLFGDSLFDLPHALSGSYHSWTGGYPNMNFVKQPIKMIYWITPTLAFFGFLLTGHRQKKAMYFFSTLLIMGLFLSKQSAPPFRDVYRTLYEKNFIFSFYREASKFWILISVGYLGILSNTVLYFAQSKSKFLYNFSLLLLVSMALLNFRPLLNREIGTLFIPRNIPNDYKVLNEHITKENKFFRTLWVPVASKWGIFSYYNPKLTLGDLVNTLDDTKYKKHFKKMHAKALNIPEIHKIVSILGVRYILVPVDDRGLEDSVYDVYGIDNPYYYYDLVRRINWYKVADIDTELLVVMENPDHYRHRLYLIKSNAAGTEEVFPQIVKENSYTYVFKLNAGQFENTKDLRLYLSDTYNPNWDIYSGHCSWYDILFKCRPHSEIKHQKSSIGTNEYILDAQFLRKNNNIRDLEFTIFFKPQAYFFVGSMFSLLTLAGVLIYMAVHLLLKIKILIVPAFYGYKT